MEETRLKERVLKRDFCTTMQNYTYSRTGKRWNQEDASLGYDAFVASLKALVSTYGKVVIEGCGTFEIIFRNGKKIKNNFGVATKYDTDGDMINAPSYQAISFKVSEIFKNEIKNLDYKFIDSEDENGGED